MKPLWRILVEILKSLAIRDLRSLSGRPLVKNSSNLLVSKLYTTGRRRLINSSPLTSSSLTLVLKRPSELTDQLTWPSITETLISPTLTLLLAFTDAWDPIAVAFVRLPLATFA